MIKIIKKVNKTIKVGAKPNKVVVKWGIYKKVYDISNITLDELFNCVLDDFANNIVSLEILPDLLRKCRTHYNIAKHFNDYKEVNL